MAKIRNIKDELNNLLNINHVDEYGFKMNRDEIKKNEDYTNNYPKNMDYEQFKILIESLEKTRDRTHSLYEHGIDLMDYEEDFHKMITMLLKLIFKEEGYDWISWYLYERVGFDGRILEAWDENQNPICDTIESLWETVKPYRKQ